MAGSTFANPNIGLTGAAVPSAAAQVGGPDAGGLLRAGRLFDLDSGAGFEFVIGANLRFSSAGGSVEAGTLADPLRIDPTGTTAQPVTPSGGSFTIDTPQLPAALVGGRLDANVGAWLGSTAPTVGQKTMASSIPVVIASDQTAVPVSGTVTATNPSVGLTGAAVPASATQVGFEDGAGDLQSARVFDGDSGVGTENVLGVNLRLSGAGGSVEAGTLADPLRVDPTGTTAQPVTDNGGSLTVDTPQLPAALVGGRLDANVGAWLGSTAPTVGQKTMASSVPVVIASDQSAVPVTGNKTNNNAAPGATNVGVLGGVATASAPSHTEGNQVALSTDLEGNARIVFGEKQTYGAAATNFTVAASATDIFTITGSASKTIRVLRMGMSAIQTTSAQGTVQIVKRSTANSGGTSATPTVVPYDSNNAAGTAVVRNYTANPTLGTTVGVIRADRLYVAAVTGNSDRLVWEFKSSPDSQPVVLRGTSQVLAINLNGITVSGNSVNCWVEWEEV